MAIENGKLAPAKTWPPLTVPISGSTKPKMLVAFCALDGDIVEARTARHAKMLRRERTMTARIIWTRVVYLEMFEILEKKGKKHS